MKTFNVYYSFLDMAEKTPLLIFETIQNLIIKHIKSIDNIDFQFVFPLASKLLFSQCKDDISYL